MRLNFLENLTHKCSYQKNLKKVNLENKLEKKKNIVKLKFAIAGAIKEHLKENFIMS